MAIQKWCRRARSQRTYFKCQKDEVPYYSKEPSLDQLEHDFDIKVKDQPTLRVNSYRYSGIDVDKTLSWQT